MIKIQSYNRLCVRANCCTRALHRYFTWHKNRVGISVFLHFKWISSAVATCAFVAFMCCRLSRCKVDIFIVAFWSNKVFDCCHWFHSILEIVSDADYDEDFSLCIIIARMNYCISTPVQWWRRTENWKSSRIWLFVITSHKHEWNDVNKCLSH